MKNYRKILITGLACGTLLAGMTGCSKKEEVELPPTNENEVVVEEEKVVSEYTISNATGEKVVELYIYPVGSEDRGTNLAGEGLEPDAEIVIDANVSDLFAPVSKDNAGDFVLEFSTETGYSGKFETLHRQVANISLLSADAAAGATQIAFVVNGEAEENPAENEVAENEVAENEVTENTETEEVKG